ncbi:hypothetical protein ILYODFUR_019460, partial [Ilyodon furcidens]
VQADRGRLPVLSIKATGHTNRTFSHVGMETVVLTITSLPWNSKYICKGSRVWYVK